MIIRIPCYTAGYRIVSLAKCFQALHHLLEQGLDALYLGNGKLTLYPDDVLLTDDAAVLERLPPSRIDGQKETRYNGKEGRQRR